MNKLLDCAVYYEQFVMDGKITKSVFVTGHNGMVGSAIVRALAQKPDVELVIAPRYDLDLLDVSAVRRFLPCIRLKKSI